MGRTEGRAVDQDHEQWVSKDSGAARVSSVTGGGSSEKNSLSCRTGTPLGSEQNVPLGSGLVLGVWIVPVYAKASLPQYC